MKHDNGNTKSNTHSAAANSATLATQTNNEALAKTAGALLTWLLFAGRHDEDILTRPWIDLETGSVYFLERLAADALDMTWGDGGTLDRVIRAMESENHQTGHLSVCTRIVVRGLKDLRPAPKRRTVTV